MNKVFIDLEMHPIPQSCKDERIICTQEIIEIGAVMLNDRNEEISSFCEFVHPAFVTKIYTKYKHKHLNYVYACISYYLYITKATPLS